jgi:hypothetical protein
MSVGTSVILAISANVSGTTYPITANCNEMALWWYSSTVLYNFKWVDMYALDCKDRANLAKGPAFSNVLDWTK